LFEGFGFCWYTFVELITSMNEKEGYNPLNDLMVRIQGAKQRLLATGAFDEEGPALATLEGDILSGDVDLKEGEKRFLKIMGGRSEYH